MPCRGAVPIDLDASGKRLRRPVPQAIVGASLVVPSLQRGRFRGRSLGGSTAATEPAPPRGEQRRSGQRGSLVLVLARPHC